MADATIKRSRAGAGTPSPTHILRRLLPAAMLLVALGGCASGLRLALALGQPFPGFAGMWRKELTVFTISYVTPPFWSGLAAGLRVNDRLLCVDGYSLPMPATTASAYAGTLREDCAQGNARYPEIYAQRHDVNPDGALSFVVERRDNLLTIAGVPLLRFDPTMLAELFLPFFLLGTGFLAIAAVAYRAAPHEEINLVFAALTTAVAGLMLDQFSALRLSHWIPDFWPVSLVLQGFWLPFMGVLVFHLIALITTPHGLADRTRRGLGVYYGLSAVVSVLIFLTYVVKNQTLTAAMTWVSLAFCTVSSVSALIWGIVRLGTVFLSTQPRRIKRQSGLMALGLATVFAAVVPLYLYYLTDLAFYRFVQSLPYLGLGGVALIAYAILRYQLFVSKSRVLTILVVTALCALAANLVYLAIGQSVSFLPILAAAALTGVILQMRRGPGVALTRLLRRETLDYQTVAGFSQQVASLQGIDAIVAATADCLRRNLDAERVDTWLWDQERQAMSRFADGKPAGTAAAPPRLIETLLAHPDPLHSAAAQAADFASLLAEAGGSVIVWAPLVDHGQAIGLLGLGPRWTGEVYDQQDVRLVAILARQAALAILNTRQIERLRATAQLIQQAEENERRKIARELHDTILQFLLVLTYGLDDLKERQAALTAEIERWQDRISAEAGQLRNLLNYLRAPELLVQQGLVRSLEAWLNQVQHETAMAIEADLAPEVEPVLSTEAKVAIYRVCREAVHNAVKHSGGSRVVVTVQPDGDSVRFSIEDDGQGFDVDTAMAGGEKGYSSLQDLRIYVESVGGHLAVQSSSDEGTSIRGWNPLKPSSLFQNLAKPSLEVVGSKLNSVKS